MIKQIFDKIKSNNLLKQSIVTLLLRVLGVATLFGFTWFLTNNFEEKVIGEYETIRTFLLVMGSIALLGTEQSIFYYAGKYQALGKTEALENIYFKMLQLILMSSVVIGIIYFFLPKSLILELYGENKETLHNITISVLVLFFYVLTLFNTEMLRALGKINISELYRNFFKFFPVILGSVYLLFKGNPMNLVKFYIYGFIVLSIITTVLVIVSFKKNSKPIESIEEAKKDIFNRSYPMSISSVCLFLMLSVDIVLLRKYYSPEIVAYYAIAVKLLTVLSMIIVVVNINVAPKLAEFYASEDFVSLKETISKSKLMIGGLNVFIGVFLIVFGKFILKMFGINYVNAYEPMVILLFGQMIVSLFGSTSMLMNMANKQQVFKNILILAVVFNIVLNLILIPKFGMIGAAISFVISLWIWNFTSVYYVKTKLLYH